MLVAVGVGCTGPVSAPAEVITVAQPAVQVEPLDNDAEFLQLRTRGHVITFHGDATERSRSYTISRDDGTVLAKLISEDEVALGYPELYPEVVAMKPHIAAVRDGP